MRHATSNGGALNERASEQSPAAFCCPHCSHEIWLGGDGLTASQRDVLTFIVGYIAQHQRSPSLGDIGKALSYKSRSKAFKVVGQLCDRGFLAKAGGQGAARNLAVLKTGAELAR